MNSKKTCQRSLLIHQKKPSPTDQKKNFQMGKPRRGTGTYQVETLQIREGQDITAPLNTLFLKLKNRATGQTPYKIIIPPGHYKLCMYSNMYLYAQGATITKTSTKHLILRLGNTKESAGGYSGYQNIVIDGVDLEL